MARQPAGLIGILRSTLGVGGQAEVDHQVTHCRNATTSALIKYKNRNGQARERVIDIYALGHGYLDAHDHASGEMRTFKLSRIRWIEPQGGKFTVPGDYGPSDWVSVGRGAF